MDRLKRIVIINALITTIAGVGLLGLLTFGMTRGFLSPRGQAIGMLLSFVGLSSLMVFLGKRAAKTHKAELAHAAPGTDTGEHHRRLRSIQIRKVWIAILVALLPIGIANGIVNHAWLPTLVGVGANLSMIYVARESIRRLRKSLDVDSPTKG